MEMKPIQTEDIYELDLKEILTNLGFDPDKVNWVDASLGLNRFKVTVKR